MRAEGTASASWPRRLYGGLHPLRKIKIHEMDDILHNAHCANKLVVVLEHENRAVSSCFCLVRDLLGCPQRKLT